jgi:uncharacterized protein
MLSRYTKSIHINASVQAVFAFHTDPGNLLRITPSNFSVRLLRFDTAGEGAIVELLVRRFGIFRMRWVMRFDDFDPPHRLSDRQVQGPFRYWKHTRIFTPDREGGCTLEDRLEYELPGGSVGRLVDRLFVSRDIRRMFAYRQEKTRLLIEADAGG